ncbi:hypothetical protein C1H46_043861 [Malus baccata]|uniref:Nucleoside phosphorylase domain-containing protein n=1 Tax=Malus baccata TaxID=106549 RepID=A0A540K8Q5_MALBA|nr:hypothetical protein C1H46_043861 [Malus baccata]
MVKGLFCHNILRWPFSKSKTIPTGERYAVNVVNQIGVKGVVHYGNAGNADPQLQIGDVTIPQFWAHTGLWNWQVENVKALLEVEVENVIALLEVEVRNTTDTKLEGCFGRVEKSNL